MVDAIVVSVVAKLGDYLIQEAAFLSDVKDEVQWLKDQLQLMQSFLKDAEKKQIVDERVGVWITRVRDIAYDAEDVLDTFILKVKVNDHSGSKQWVNSLRKYFSFSRLSALRNIHKQIEALKRKINGIASDRVVYGISNINDEQGWNREAHETLRDLRRTTSYIDEEAFVGLEDDLRLLEGKLLQSEPRRCVISILGMGGLGKTTLARRLYNKCKSQFNCCAWVCVSQEWRTRDLLERILKSFKELSRDEMKMFKRMNNEDVERYIRKLLVERQYLVVIDDTWDTRAWESLKRALPDNKNKCRIIITTRIEAVAELYNERTYVHRLRFLQPGESWKLFCKKAFSNNNTVIDGDGYHCPLGLENIGKEMVAKCEGLPLAIVVLGGLLSRKEPHEWPTMKERIWQELRRNSDHISLLLSLSFNDLPHQLKSCFLYLGLFPEDSVIDAVKLTRLWIAEGFIRESEGTLDLEEVAEEYLKELSGRSLVQVVKKTWRRITGCRVHDLLRDLAIGKAGELNFFHIRNGNSSSAHSFLQSSNRRLASYSEYDTHIILGHSNARMRAILLFGPQFQMDIELANRIDTKFTLLRVVDFAGVQFFSIKRYKDLPNAIGKLVHLRYLGLLEPAMFKLPDSVANLHALQTLDVPCSHHPPMELSREICKLKQLRHLRGEFVAGPQPKIGNLTNLRTLETLQIDGSREEVQAVMNSIGKLRNLKHLSIQSLDGVILPIQPLSTCQHLIELEIEGATLDLPVPTQSEMHEYPPNLKDLILKGCSLLQDPLPTLGMLPNLMVLFVQRTKVKIMTCSTATCFPQLELLVITSAVGMEKIQVEEGAMPRLRALSIPPCQHILSERLRSLPSVDPTWLTEWFPRDEEELFRGTFFFNF